MGDTRRRQPVPPNRCIIILIFFFFSARSAQAHTHSGGCRQRFSLRSPRPLEAAAAPAGSSAAAPQQPPASGSRPAARLRAGCPRLSRRRPRSSAHGYVAELPPHPTPPASRRGPRAAKPSASRSAAGLGWGAGKAGVPGTKRWKSPGEPRSQPRNFYRGSSFQHFLPTAVALAGIAARGKERLSPKGPYSPKAREFDPTGPFLRAPTKITAALPSAPLLPWTYLD